MPSLCGFPPPPSKKPYPAPVTFLFLHKYNSALSAAHLQLVFVQLPTIPSTPPLIPVDLFSLSPSLLPLTSQPLGPLSGSPILSAHEAAVFFVPQPRLVPVLYSGPFFFFCEVLLFRLKKPNFPRAFWVGIFPFLFVCPNAFWFHNQLIPKTRFFGPTSLPGFFRQFPSIKPLVCFLPHYLFPQTRGPVGPWDPLGFFSVSGPFRCKPLLFLESGSPSPTPLQYTKGFSSPPPFSPFLSFQPSLDDCFFLTGPFFESFLKPLIPFTPHRSCLLDPFLTPLVAPHRSLPFCDHQDILNPCPLRNTITPNPPSLANPSMAL